MMKLSVIIACYNGEDFIEHAIESVQRQQTENIELIIVDDGSTDQTAEKCAPYVCENIRYIYTENMGAGHARNVGIDAANGQWVSFLDADDLYLAGTLGSRIEAELEKADAAGLDIICTPRSLTDMNLETPVQVYYSESVEQIVQNHHMPSMAFWACFFRASFLKEKNIRFYEYRVQDVESAFRYLTFSQTSNIAVRNDYRFYLQRDNLSSNTHTWNHYNLYIVKAHIYWDLYKNTPHESDKVYLLSVAMEQIRAYYRLCVYHGKTENSSGIATSIDELYEIIKTSVPAMQFKQVMTLGDRAKIEGARLLLRFTNRIAQIPKKQKEQFTMLSKDEIMERLQRVSE